MNDLISPQEYMPFLLSLDKNVTRGKAVVPGLGGETANSEFEFLTGLTMTFLPDGSFPYLQYIDSDINTLFQNLDSNIYQKTYVHPYIASNYKRSNIFGFLGFDTFYDGLYFSSQDSYTEKYTERSNFLEYDGVDMVRGYIGDGVVYDNAVEMYESKPEGTRLSQFIVTMQNHSPYNYEGDDFVTDVISGTGDAFTDQYLSLIKISDSELERLINYFSEAEEDTVIVFFGDHKPYLTAYAEKESAQKTEEDVLLLHSTPFIIWTNFDTETEDLGYVSLNYLSALMKEKSGMPLTPFDNFRLELYDKYPVFSANIIMDSDGNYYGSDFSDELIKEYEYLQYYYLFDNGGF